MSKSDPYRKNWEVAEPLVRYELGQDLVITEGVTQKVLGNIACI